MMTDDTENLVDFAVHDARVWVLILTTEAQRTKGRYGYGCRPCGADVSGYATGGDAKAAAIRHNGGAYNEANA